MTFADISTMCVDFCMKINTTGMQEKVHINTKFCGNTFENGKIMLFQSFLNVPSVVSAYFTSNLSVAVKRVTADARSDHH